MTPDDLARAIAAAVHDHREEPPATRQLRAAGEALNVLDPLSRAIYVCKSPELQMRICDELKDALLRAIAHVQEARQLIELDPAAAWAPPATPPRSEPDRG